MTANDPRYSSFTNYIPVWVTKREIYQIAHIKAGACSLSPGDMVEIGQQIALTEANGWMPDTRHLHFMVGQLHPNGNYQSVRIRWSLKQTYAPAKE